MAKKNTLLTRKNLGILILGGLLIQFILPAIKLGNFAWISTVIYLVVALYLIFS